MSGRMLMRAVVVLATTLTTVSVAPAAHANVPGRVVIAHDATIQPGSSIADSAYCPRGTSITGGGYFHGSTPGVQTWGNHPVNGFGPAWSTSMINNDPWANPVTVYGVCTSLPSQLTAAANLTVPAGGSAAATIPCPAGTSATGGGVISTDDLVVDTSRPSGTGWYAHVYNPQPVAFNSYVRAVCTTVSRTVVTSSFTAGAYVGWDTVATCPAGQMALGGGWAFTPATGLIIDITRPSTFSQGWHVHAYNTTPVARTVTAYSTCA